MTDVILENLTMFIYLLTRDEVPFGKVCKIVQDIEKVRQTTGDLTPDFTNKSQEEFAKSIAQRLLEAREQTF